MTRSRRNSHREVCQTCGGTGHGLPTREEPDGAKGRCYDCNGTGLPPEPVAIKIVPCSYCNGTGKSIYSGFTKTCKFCRGYGEVVE